MIGALRRRFGRPPRGLPTSGGRVIEFTVAHDVIKALAILDIAEAPLIEMTLVGGRVEEDGSIVFEFEWAPPFPASVVGVRTVFGQASRMRHFDIPFVAAPGDVFNFGWGLRAGAIDWGDVE